MKKQIFVLLTVFLTTFQIHAQIRNVKLLPDVSKQVDLMIEHDKSATKRHLELMNKGSQGALSEIKGLTDEWKTVEQADKVLLKTIFKDHGFLGNSEVGEESSRNFLLMVQRFDSDSTFQQQVLVEMKKHVDKINTSPIEFANLTDRVKLNQKKLQVYGTQLELNEKGTSFEPKPVIDPQNLNKRRAEVGLGTIEDAIMIMNGYFLASLKK